MRPPGHVSRSARPGHGLEAESAGIARPHMPTRTHGHAHPRPVLQQVRPAGLAAPRPRLPAPRVVSLLRDLSSKISSCYFHACGSLFPGSLSGFIYFLYFNLACNPVFVLGDICRRVFWPTRYFLKFIFDIVHNNIRVSCLKYAYLHVCAFQTFRLILSKIYLLISGCPQYLPCIFNCIVFHLNSLHTFVQDALSDNSNA